MESQATASIDLANLLLEFATARRIDTGAALSAAGITNELLEDREARIPFGQYQALWQAITVQSGDQDFGLHFGEAARQFPSGHLLGAVMMNSPEVSGALDRFFRYHALMSDAVTPRLDRSGEHSRITAELAEPDLQFDRHYTEANLCVILAFVRKLCRGRVNPLEVQFTHPAPADISGHKRIFDCPLRFEQPESGLQFENRVLDRPLRHADPGLLEMMERVAEERLARSVTRPGWAHKSERSILRTLLGGSKPSVEAAARDLAVSVRHLQGRLKDEGTTYQQVLERVRQDLARDYLDREDLSLCEVAFLLGYAEQSTFNHAFKRWTGSTPSEYRGK